jgi:LDH2 family malate/lactate/ureidoglycolate dehydrogenase
LVVVTDKQLQELGTKTFMAVGVPKDEAAFVTDCLVRANLKGVDSHGVQQIPGYVKLIQAGKIKPGAKIKLLKETAATALFDGGSGFGYTMAREAMEATMKKARIAGIAFSGVQNLGHIGRVGRWAEMALENNMIGIASQPGGIYIAPWGGIERKFPIAPIAISIPTDKHPPIVIDMSLGPLAGGRASILALRKQKLPLGWLIDNEGKPTDDPAVFDRNEGAQLPLGQAGLGYKGMALALVEQIFSGPLIGVFKGQGVFFQVINIEAFTSLSDFKKEMDAVIANIKASKLAPGFKEILMPGEPEWREQARRMKEGIFLDDTIYKGILDTAESVKVDTKPYKGKIARALKAEITHPSYTLKERY